MNQSKLNIPLYSMNIILPWTDMCDWNTVLCNGNGNSCSFSFPQAFTIMDQNRDGFIDKADLRDTFAALGKIIIQFQAQKKRLVLEWLWGKKWDTQGAKGNLFCLTFLLVAAGISLLSSSWKVSWAGSGMKVWSLPCNCFRRSPPKQGSMPGISDLPLNPGFFIWEPWNIHWLALQSWTSCPSAHTNLGGLHVKFCTAESLCGVKCACHEIRYCPFHGYHNLGNIKQIRANLP